MAEDLLSMFTSMGTTDHTQLLQQFLQVIPGAPTEAAQFFLEANSMNLQAAIMCYMDQGGTGMVAQAMVQPPQVRFVGDVTIGEGEAVSPDTKFQKTWRLQNVGHEAWPENTTLNFVQGEQLGHTTAVRVPQIPPGEMADVSVDMQSPAATGSYAGSWRLCVVQGAVPSYFGDEFWVVITVSETGMLDALQRMHGTQIDPNAVADPSMAMGGAGSMGGGGFGAFGGQHVEDPMQQQQQQQQVFGQPQQASEAAPQANANPFGVPMFGALSGHSFGQNMPAFGAPPAGEGFGQTFGQQPGTGQGFGQPEQGMEN